MSEMRLALVANPRHWHPFLETSHLYPCNHPSILTALEKSSQSHSARFVHCLVDLQTGIAQSPGVSINFRIMF